MKCRRVLVTSKHDPDRRGRRGFRCFSTAERNCTLASLMCVSLVFYGFDAYHNAPGGIVAVFVYNMSAPPFDSSLRLTN